MRLRPADDDVSNYDMYFNGTREPVYIEADSHQEYMLKRAPDHTIKRYNGTVQFVDKLTGVVYGRDSAL